MTQSTAPLTSGFLTRGGVTGLYYVLTYLGFAAPWLLALAVRVVPAPWVLLALALHAALTAAWFRWLHR